MKNVQLEFRGEVITVPESEADWFIKEKGAKKVSSKAVTKKAEK